MQNKLIYHNADNRRLILIFAGWSTTPSFYRDLHAPGWDIAVTWDYSSLDFDPEIIKGYETIFIIAWSMGVAAAAHAAATTLDSARISAAFAVNGTLYPSSDDYGIPADIYEATQATLSPKNLIRFTKRMGYVPPAPGSMPPLPPDEIYIPDFEKLSFELRNVRDNALRGALPWKRAFISLNDSIFPAESMERAWRGNPANPLIVHLDAPHYVHLQPVIDTVIPDTCNIARRFESASSTYDENAGAQKIIADTLVKMLPESFPHRINSLLEIGAGSGLLSRTLSERISAEKAVFLDLYPIRRLNLFADENYVEADVEKWIIDAPDNSFDMVASGSTIQWLADPDAFFRHSARILRDGGILLCSTFLPGNLRELDSMRPAPLIYRSKEELHDMLSRHFRRVEFKESPISITFHNRRDLLLHIKRTGVAGGLPSTLPISPTPSADSGLMVSPVSSADSGSLTLTYMPLYILASNR